ncbi:MAG: ribonuclease III [Halanaerobiaceae bacterium]
MYDSKIQQVEEELNIEFSDQELIQRALIHKSYVNENPGQEIKNNERLEFLGDSVLNLTISSYIFRKFTDYPEGKLAKMRAILVSAPILSRKAREFNLGEYVIMGRGEEMTGGRERDSILADTMEAVFGAIYLDKGIKEVSDFIIDIFSKDIEIVSSEEYIRDYKTRLQELTQEQSTKRPEYNVVAEKGPDHNKTFAVEVSFDGKVLGQGTASSIKEAEQDAAKEAFLKLQDK